MWIVLVVGDYLRCFGVWKWDYGEEGEDGRELVCELIEELETI